MGCDSWSAGVAMGRADSDDEMGMGMDGEYGLGWNGEDREAKASRARAGMGVATVATTVLHSLYPSMVNMGESIGNFCVLQNAQGESAAL